LFRRVMIDDPSPRRECDLNLTPPARSPLERLTEAGAGAGSPSCSRGGIPRSHRSSLELVKQLAHSLLADDERLVAGAMPRETAVAGPPPSPATGAPRTEGWGLGRSAYRLFASWFESSVVNAARITSWAWGAAPIASKPERAAPRREGPARTSLGPRGDVVDSLVITAM